MDSKLRIAMLVGILFLVPAALTLYFITSDFATEPKLEPQAGGVIHGKVTDRDGKPLARMEVRLETVRLQDNETLIEAAGVTLSDAAGAFELAAPPVNGRYSLSASGGTWQRATRPFSFQSSKAKDGPFTLALQPGCELEIDLVRSDGRPAGAGVYDLHGEFDAGLFFGLVRPRLQAHGSIKDGKLQLAGLPTMKAEITAKMDSGERIELKFEVVLGENKRRVEY